ncbi:hypothetical protein LguiB_000701 [Lonicera macranthoides]
MTTPLPFTTIIVIIIIIITAATSPPAASLGSTSTIAISHSSTATTVCGITAGGPTAGGIRCYKNGQIIPISPKISYSSISGGRNFFCGLPSAGLSLLCWDTTTFRPRRISSGHRLTDLTVGESQVCAIQSNTSVPACWRFPSPEGLPELQSITSGNGFSCGILKNNSIVICWGVGEIQAQFGKFQCNKITTSVNKTFVDYVFR